MAQVLTNAFHLKAKSDHTFNDVSSNSWARNAISAVQTNNIAKGVGEGKFAPSMDVTREQYAQFYTMQYKKLSKLNKRKGKYWLVYLVKQIGKGQKSTTKIIMM